MKLLLNNNVISLDYEWEIKEHKEQLESFKRVAIWSGLEFLNENKTIVHGDSSQLYNFIRKLSNEYDLEII